MTPRRPVEEELCWLAAIVESSDDAIISEDLDGLLTSWNPGAERIYGYRAEEVLGQPRSIIIPPARITLSIDRPLPGSSGHQCEHTPTSSPAPPIAGINSHDRGSSR